MGSRKLYRATDNIDAVCSGFTSDAGSYEKMSAQIGNEIFEPLTE